MADIQSELDSILFTWSQDNSIPVAWQNLDFDSSNVDSFVQAFMLPAQTVPVGIDDSDASNFTGIYQVSIYTKKGIGTKASRTLSASLLAAFSKGSGANGTRVEQSWISGELTDEAWFIVPLSVRYRSFA